MSAKPSFSLGRALAAAVAAVPAAWGGAWLAMILVWAGLTFGSPFALSMHVHVARTGEYGGAVVHTSSLGFLVYGLIMLILSLTARGAVYRAILFGKDARKEGLGLGGLQFGWPELRLLASDVLAALFIGLIGLAAFIVFAVSFSTTGDGHGGNTIAAIRRVFCRHQGSDWVFIAYLAGVAVFIVFLQVKLTLRHAATIAERRIVALNSLGLSSGNVGKLFIGLIVVSLPVFVIVHVLLYAAMPHIALGHAQLHQQLFGTRLWLRAAVHAVAIAGLGPLLAGFLSSAYRQIVDLRAK